MQQFEGKIKIKIPVLSLHDVIIEILYDCFINWDVILKSLILFLYCKPRYAHNLSKKEEKTFKNVLCL